jgi:hypothetical protein
MAIEVGGRRYQTLSDDIFVNNKKVYQVDANDKKVYPDGRKPITEGQGMYALVFGHYTFRQTHEHNDENATYEITGPLDDRPYHDGRMVTAYEVRHHHSATYEFSLGFVTALKAASADRPFVVHLVGFGGPSAYIASVDEDTNKVVWGLDKEHASFKGFYDYPRRNEDLNLASTLTPFSEKYDSALSFSRNGPIDGSYPVVGFDDWPHWGGFEVLDNKYEYETSGPNVCGPVYSRIEEVFKINGRVYPPISYYTHVTAACGDFYDIARIHGDAAYAAYDDGVIIDSAYYFFSLYGKTDVTCNIVHSGDLNNDYINHNTQTLLIACAPSTDILYIGDDPGMASVDRVEIVKNGKDYTYRLLD